MSTPTISVLITVFNREAYLAEAIESVLSQSYTDYELIIVDDGSTDASVKVARQYLSDQRLSLHVNESNLGDYPNRNRAASLAQGDYLKYVDADDIIYPHCLELMLGAMETFPDASWGASRELHGRRPPCQLSPMQAYRAHFLDGTGLFSSGPLTTIIRRDAFDRVGGFNDARHTSDGLCWMALSQQSPVAIAASGLVWWRHHDEQESRVRQRTPERALEVAARRYRNATSMLENVDCPLSAQDRRDALRKTAQDYRRFVVGLLRRGRPKAATEALRQANMSWMELLLTAPGRPSARNSDPASPHDVSQGSSLPSSQGKASPTEPDSSTSIECAATRIGTPTVSVLISAHNAEDTIGDAIACVLAQTYQNWELILVDDASTDGTLTAAQKHLGDPRITVLHNTSPRGDVAAHNQCADLAHGHWIKFLEPVDILYPHALALMVSFMAYHTDAALGIACSMGAYREASLLTSAQVMCAEFFATPMLNCSLSSTIIRRSAYGEVGGMLPSVSPPERRLQFDLATMFPVVRLTSGLANCRDHGGTNRSLCGHWRYGWGEGAEWLLQWLQSPNVALSAAQVDNAAANILRYLWFGGDRLTQWLAPPVARKARALSIRLADEWGIPRTRFTTPPKDKRGWTTAMRDEERLIAWTPPELAPFFPNTRPPSEQTPSS